MNNYWEIFFSLYGSLFYTHLCNFTYSHYPIHSISLDLPNQWQCTSVNLMWDRGISHLLMTLVSFVLWVIFQDMAVWTNWDHVKATPPRVINGISQNLIGMIMLETVCRGAWNLLFCEFILKLWLFGLTCFVLHVPSWHIWSGVLPKQLLLYFSTKFDRTWHVCWGQHVQCV